MNQRKFNGEFVTNYLKEHPQMWKALVAVLWPDTKQQSKTYFRDKESISTTTLAALHDVTQLPWDCFFIREGEEQPDIKNIDQRVEIHHNHINTLNANSNPEVLLAYIDMANTLLAEKDQRIADLKSQVADLRETIKAFSASKMA